MRADRRQNGVCEKRGARGGNGRRAGAKRGTRMAQERRNGRAFPKSGASEGQGKFGLERTLGKGEVAKAQLGGQPNDKVV